ncbi:MAG: siderophore ABC transporter substrate-binding protein [Clostridiales bacterium]|nr:siderophore ABC transporter substrate-binding protein [Clostridiales bacterium]
MKKLGYFLLVGVMGAMTLVGCSSKGNDVETTKDVETTTVVEEGFAEVVVEHLYGTTVVDKEVEKAVVFDFGALDTIDTLGIEVELAVVQASLPEYLSQYADTTVNAGSLKEPDLEAIFTFAPDVIIISGRQATYYEQLTEIAPTIYIELNADTYMEDFTKNTNMIASLFQVENKVQEELAAIEAQVEEVKTIAANLEDKALILLTNDGSVSVYGKGSRFGIIHDVLGVKTADENIESSTHGQEANYEYISQMNPDIIFVVDRTLVVGGTNEANTTLDNELVNSTNAAINNKIISLNPDYWYLSAGGIKSVSEMILNIKTAIQ